jgi:hypothetical protein
MTRATGHVFPFLLHPISSKSSFLMGCSFSRYFYKALQSACVCLKQKPAVGQPLNLQTLPSCLFMLVAVLTSPAEARLRCTISGHVPCKPSWKSLPMFLHMRVLCFAYLRLHPDQQDREAFVSIRFEPRERVVSMTTHKFATRHGKLSGQQQISDEQVRM